MRPHCCVGRCPGADGSIFLHPGLDLVCRSSGIARHSLASIGPISWPRWRRSHDPTPTMAAVLDSLASVEDVAVATEPTRRAQLWRYRERHTEAINTLGAPHKLDVTLPAPVFATFVDEVPGLVKAANQGRPLGSSVTLAMAMSTST